MIGEVPFWILSKLSTKRDYEWKADMQHCVHARKGFTHIHNERSEIKLHRYRRKTTTSTSTWFIDNYIIRWSSTELCVCVVGGGNLSLPLCV